MKKIYKLKEWYSLEDTAERLSLTLGEKIEIKDLVQLAVEGHIKLSWYMRHVTAREVEFKEYILKPSPLFPERTDPISIWDYYPTDKEMVDILDGPHYLMLKECGALADYLLALITNTGGELCSIDGYYVCNNEGKVWNIVERFDDQHIKDMGYDQNPKIYDSRKYFPSGEWPEISELGFTKRQLEDFEVSLQEKGSDEKSKSLSTEPAQKPLHTKEKETLLKMIIGMAIKGYTHDPKAKKSNTVSEVKGDLDSLGINLDEDTIRKWLKEAAALLPQTSEKP